MVNLLFLLETGHRNGNRLQTHQKQNHQHERISNRSHMEMGIVTNWDDMEILLNEHIGDLRADHSALHQAVDVIYGVHDESKTRCNAA